MTAPRRPANAHDLISTNGAGEQRWTSCRCGWLSPVVADQRTARQAHYAHHREATLDFEPSS